MESLEGLVGELAEILEVREHHRAIRLDEDYHAAAFRRSLELLHLRLTESRDPPPREELDARLRELIRLAIGPFAQYQRKLVKALVRLHTSRP